LYFHHHHHQYINLVSFPHVALVYCFLAFVVVVVVTNNWPALVEEFCRGGTLFLTTELLSLMEETTAFRSSDDRFFSLDRY
jgi:hypothetical protein